MQMTIFRNYLFQEEIDACPLTARLRAALLGFGDIFGVPWNFFHKREVETESGMERFIRIRFLSRIVLDFQQVYWFFFLAYPLTFAPLFLAHKANSFRCWKTSCLKSQEGRGKS